jgi:hypothetical protein
VTFKTGHNSYGPVEYQIDRNSTRRDGPYLTFQARIWAEPIKQPIVITINEALVYWSKTLAVDCAHRKFGAQFIDTNPPAEARHKMALQNMRWTDLDKTPTVGRVLCEDQ